VAKQVRDRKAEAFNNARTHYAIAYAIRCKTMLNNTRLLAYWYSNQIMCVKWQNTEIQYFKIANGVRQSGILSPFCFVSISVI